MGQRLTAHLHALGQRPARYNTEIERRQRYQLGGTVFVQLPGSRSFHLPPDSGDGSCVAMTSGQVGGFWDDKPCSDRYKFMCEKFRPDISPPTKPPTPPPAQGCADGWTAKPHFRNCYKVRNEQPTSTSTYQYDNTSITCPR